MSSAITIELGATLTIEAGTEIIVTDSGRIRVLGALNVNGTLTDPVIFKENATSTHKRMDVYVDGGNLSLDHTQFSRPLRIYSQNSAVKVRDSIFKDLGLYVDGKSMLFERIHIETADDIYITNNTADLSSVSIDKGKRLYITEGSTVTLLDSVIRDMRDPTAAIMIFGNSSVSMSSSTISLSKNRAIHIDGESSLRINDSTIEDYGDSGIFANNADISVLNSYIRGGKKGIDNVRADISITDSAVTDNSEYGALARNADFPIDAVGNFWGDKSGPYHPESNPNGLGNAVSDNVEYIPWLTHSPDDCCSSVLFLPGFQASRLYIREDILGIGVENRLWEPNHDNDGRLLEMDPNGNNINEVYTKPGDVLAEVFAPLYARNLYKSFMNDLDELQRQDLIADWAPVSYDWRFSVDDVIEKGIIGELEYLAAHSHTGRVTIVAHSNGGLVTKALMRKLEAMGKAKLVDKIVFVAVPQLGTPKAIGSLLHGFKQGIPILFSAAAARQLGQNMPGAYGLLPSALYSSLGVGPLVIFDQLSNFPWLVQNREMFGVQIDTSQDLMDFLIGKDDRTIPAQNDLTNPGILNSTLLDRSLSTHVDIDSWMPPRGVRLFEIAGWGLDTVSGIRYYEGTRYKKPALNYKPLFTYDGDGTVVTRSALALPTADNIEEYRIDMWLANKGFGINRAHADILEILPLRQLVKSLILRQPEILPSLQYVSGGKLGENNEPADIVKEVTRIFVHSSVDVATEANTNTAEVAAIVAVNVHNNQGDHTGISATTGLPENNIIGASYQELGSVTYISVPSTSSESPALSLPLVVTVSSGENNSITIDIEDESGVDSSFTDVEISTSTIINIDIEPTASSSPVLDIDDDGDGSIDREVNSDNAKDEKIIADVAINVAVDSDIGRIGGGGSRSGGRRHIVATTTEDVLIFIDSPIEPLSQAATLATSTATSSVISAEHTQPTQTASVFDAADSFWKKILVKLRDFLQKPPKSSILISTKARESAAARNSHNPIILPGNAKSESHKMNGKPTEVETNSPFVH